MLDPTKAEMVAFLAKQFDHDGDEFDLEAAIYWFAFAWHGGQNSNLYSAGSTSKYSPGIATHFVNDETDLTIWMYEALEAEYASA